MNLLWARQTPPLGILPQPTCAMARCGPILGGRIGSRLRKMQVIAMQWFTWVVVIFTGALDHAGKDADRGISLTRLCDLHHLVM